MHNYGISCNSKAIRDLCDKYELLLIEDCAEAWFSRSGGELVGTFADLATFSMHATKTISSGEGGVILVKDRFYQRAKLLRSHGLDRTTGAYDHKLPGNNYRLSNILAAIGCGQLRDRDAILFQQRSGIDHYLELLADTDLITLQFGVDHSQNLPWAIAARIKSCNLTLSRDDLIVKLNESGIETRPGFLSANKLSYNREFSSACPVAEALHEDLIVLPCPLSVQITQIKFIAEKLHEICDDKSKPTNKKPRCIYKEKISVKKLQNFISKLKYGRENFRYFDTRSIEKIMGNSFLVVTDNEEEYTGYGHIDFDGKNHWLGICVADEHVGTKTGHLLMQEIIKAARLEGFKSLHLKVDNENFKAIGLYEKYGFVKVEQKMDVTSSHFEFQIC